MYYYGARYYDPRNSIFVSVDPLAENAPSYGGYIYTFNNPINLVDPDGRWPKLPSWKEAKAGLKKDVQRMYVNSGIKHAVDWFRGEPRYTNIPKKGMIMSLRPLIENPISTIQCHHCANIGDINLPDTSPYLQGSLNILSGTLGTVGASAYIIETDGVGAALGGSTALTLSIGQISVGVSQIGDELRGGK